MPPPIDASGQKGIVGGTTEETLLTMLTKASFQERINTLGQKPSAGSTPVVLASDQPSLAVTGSFFQAVQPVSGTFFPATQPISAAALPLPAGASTELTLAAMSAKLPATLGSKTSTASLSVVPSVDPTYAAATGPFAPTLLPTDVFVITGSATKTVRVRKIVVTATQTNAGYARLAVIKRSADDTGGTSVPTTRVPLDSANAAATAAARHYTANPAVGLAVGVVRDDKVFVATNGPIATSTPSERSVFDFSDAPVVLRGAAEILSVSLNGVTLAGGNVNIDVEWSEQ